MRRAYRPQSRFPDQQAQEQAAERASGWTKQELLDAVPEGELSPKTFDTIRKAARVSGPSHGGRNHVFSADDVMALIAKCESGRFTERGPVAAVVWRGLLAAAGVKVPEQVPRGRRR